jgi:hypothetical protein
MHTFPDSRYPHICGSTVVSRTEACGFAFAWWLSPGFSSYSGLALEPVFTRTMRRLHPCVISTLVLSHPFLTTNTITVVLVLDQPPISGRASNRRIHLAVGGIICFGDPVHPTAFLGEGSLVSR